MKKMFFLLILCAVPFCRTIAQCNEYYQVEDASEWEMETYNARGKLTGKNQQTVIRYEKTGDGFTATIHSVFHNEKGKELTNGDLELKCSHGTVYIDMRNFISEEQMKVFKSYEITMEGDNLEVPSALSVGQALKDGTFTITATGAPLPMKMIVSITDRKVEAKEKMTTPAGTFDCYKISSKMTMQNQMGVNMTFNFASIEWLAPKVGVVKSESYNKNDKLIGYTLLTKRK